ncbi:hypothetical protein H310_04577 [Aphanomyces invadans]|uniref:Uncharacterized protein n=1 Tax=Aphanomyces invadans TaxID=157072 RepID=A0A024UF28_9STRA|nr:hypothetical protein H310_04577 [Aphanomyces invadans]ETW04248.1 hypothetical protein H310_04577 [Aphanomyces invadans]|eukprot:XP_008867204.1 hypothetical protein H310_04577 [Aphanomyces invadans]
MVADCPDAIWIASRKGNTEVVKHILEETAAVHKVRWSGVTALHRACEGGNLDTIELLLDRGADINARSTWGWYSPLHVACRYGQEATVKYLLSRGADWTIKDKRKLTPFKYAIRAGHASMAHRIDEWNVARQKCHL